MSDTLTCACGTTVPLPEGAEGQIVRCPACLQAIVIPGGATPPLPTDAAAVCPICQTVLHAEDQTTACPLCHQRHHTECWAEVGGCSTYGCPQAPEAPKPEAPARPRTAWGDFKRCPACGARLRSTAMYCRACGEEFDTVDPMTPRDLARRDRQRRETTSLQIGTIVTFALTLIGCLAPITLIFGLCYFLPRRQQLAKAGPAFQVLAFFTIGLAALYSMLLLYFTITATSGP